MKVIFYEFKHVKCAEAELDENTILPDKDIYSFEIFDDNNNYVIGGTFGWLDSVEMILDGESPCLKLMSETAYTDYKIFAQKASNINGTRNVIVNFDDKIVGEPVWDYQEHNKDVMLCDDKAQLGELFEKLKKILLEENEKTKKR